MASNYSKNLYQDYEKAQLKLDAILLELCNIKKEHRKELNKISKEFKKEISSLNDTIIDLNKKLNEANKLIEKLKNDNDRLKIKITKIRLIHLNHLVQILLNLKKLVQIFIITDLKQTENQVVNLVIREVI